MTSSSTSSINRLKTIIITNHKMTEPNLCYHCKKKEPYLKIDFYTHKLCKKCFIGIVEKRIRKYIRVNELFDARDNICVINDGSSSGILSEYMIRELSEKMPIRITVRKRLSESAAEKFDKIILPINADRYTDSFFDKLFFGNAREFYKDNKKIISILQSITEKECHHFVKIKKLGEPKLENHLLDEFESPYPETKFASLKSIELLGKIIKS